MSTPIRRLNEKGLKFFQDYIGRIAGGEKNDPPIAILTDDNWSESVDLNLDVDGSRTFTTRYEMGEYLVQLFDGINPQVVIADTGLWSWLALLWFNQLCPAKADGSRKPSKPYNYILSPNYNHRPRHALRTTWQLVSGYGEAAHFLLSKGPNERGELLEQLAARQFFIGCKGIIETASQLYSDPARNTFKVGSTSQKRRGNIRRYINYLQQLELTYDLYTLPRNEIINMLPAEYSGFLSEQGSS
jgi:hypothetical protein